MSLIENTPEEEAASRERMLRIHYITGMIDDPETTPDQVESWFADQSPEIQEEVLAEQARYQSEMAAINERHEKSRNELVRTAPELLAGRLPADLAEKLGSDQYFLGSNQTMAESAQEGADYLDSMGGIELGGYDLSGRALWFDESTSADFVDHAVVEGYLQNPDVGRFIVALPHESMGADYSIDQTMKEMRAESKIPSDYIVQNADQEVINQKYCAGFIDNTGAFHENPNFMQDQPLESFVADYDDFI